MSNCDWTNEETILLIQKRLEMFKSPCGDVKVYDRISDYLTQEHGIYKNASACQSRFNNVLKTYRLCAKRLAEHGQEGLRKMRFPFFDIFHQHYTTADEDNDESNQHQCWKAESTHNGDISYVVDGDDEEGYCMAEQEEFQESPERMRNEREANTQFTRVNSRVDELKRRLMEQKLLFYTNQNMLLQDKQEYYRQREQDRAREQQTDVEIPKVLRGIRSCLLKSQEMRVVPSSTKKAVRKVAAMEKAEKNITEQTNDFGSDIPVQGETDEEKPCASERSSEEDIKEPEKARLQVRKNIFPAWNRTQTVLLIKIHCDLRPKFKGLNLFECISNKLIELHINRTPRDCRTRWNNLFRTYKECRLRLQMNDKAPVKFEYFDEIDAYYKDRQFLSMSMGK